MLYFSLPPVPGIDAGDDVDAGGDPFLQQQFGKRLSFFGGARGGEQKQRFHDPLFAEPDAVILPLFLDDHVAFAREPTDAH